MKEGLYLIRYQILMPLSVTLAQDNTSRVCPFYSQPTSLHLTSNVFAVFCVILPSKLKYHTLNITMLEEHGYKIQAKTIFQGELLMNVKFRKNY